MKQKPEAIEFNTVNETSNIFLTNGYIEYRRDCGNIGQKALKNADDKLA